MVQQKSITSFFQPRGTGGAAGAPMKRSALVEEKQTKKQKKDSEDSDTNECAGKENMNGLHLSKIIKLADSKVLGCSFGQSWYCALEKEFKKPYFEKLSAFVNGERRKCTVYPPEEDVFSWTRHCPISGVKVVILGQDPYHGPNQAHGLCFSVQPGVTPPPSLKNMYKELESDIEGFKKPGHGYLLGWARQGVLLLNSVLTVKAANANSHKDEGWETFTTAVVKEVAERNKGVVFLLWGAYAQKKVAAIKTSDHHLLQSVHPSPLSAHRGFFGCKHFSKCNELLQKMGKTPIDWAMLPLE